MALAAPVLVGIIDRFAARARQILDKIGPLPEASLLATLCIVLVDEIRNKKQEPTINEEDLREILARIKEIKHKISL